MDHKKMLSLAALIIAFSIGYYFVIYLPKQKSQELEMLQQQKIDAETKKTENQRQLNDCLSKADSDGTSFWNRSCKDFGTDKKTDDCLLPKYNADRVANSVKDAKDLCFKQYPQN